MAKLSVLPTIIILDDEDRRWLSGDWRGFEFHVKGKRYRVTEPDETYPKFDWKYTVDGEPGKGWMHPFELKAHWLDKKLWDAVDKMLPDDLLDKKLWDALDKMLPDDLLDDTE